MFSSIFHYYRHNLRKDIYTFMNEKEIYMGKLLLFHLVIRYMKHPSRKKIRVGYILQSVKLNKSNTSYKLCNYNVIFHY